MILYNVTISVDINIQEEWLKWMREIHIPEVIATGCFLESRLSKIEAEESGGVAFSVMYLCPSKEMYSKYQEKFAKKLQAEHKEKFQGKFVAFRTLLSVIDEFRVDVS
jgi:hypothetical protein